MRRDVVQQLRFDNATDLAAAVGVLLLPIAYCVVVAAAGLEPGLHESGDPFSADHASRFCVGSAIWWLVVMLIAALSTQRHANGVLQRHCVQIKLMLAEQTVPEMYQPLDAGHPRMTVRDTTGQQTISTAQGIRDLGLRFGQWCWLLKEQTAGTNFKILKTGFNTLVALAWIGFPFILPNVPTMIPPALLVLTISGYMAFNMGYRIGVRRALRSNLELLGVQPNAK